MSKTKSNELKPCPFCGGIPKVVESTPTANPDTVEETIEAVSFVGCVNEDCVVEPSIFGFEGESLAELIPCWNTRLG